MLLPQEGSGVGMEAACDPIEILLEYEHRARRIALPLPIQIQPELRWSGITFQLDGNDCIAPMGEIIEVIPIPTITPVPHTQSWALGIANIRGILVSVTHLASYLKHRPEIDMDKRSRLLLVREGGEVFGLVVDRAFGVRNIVMSDFERQQSVDSSLLQPYTVGACTVRHGLHRVISLRRIVAETRFQDAAFHS